MTLRGKKVLVTGADGFIGSHLVEQLVAEECAVRAFVMYNSFSEWGWLDALQPSVRDAVDVFPGDVRDPRRVADAVQDVEVVFHLAALISIPYSYVAPESYVDTNIKGTVNVLEAARRAGTAKVLVTSTSEVYGTARYVPIDEAHPFQGQSPYAASKIAADRMAEAYHLSYGVPVVTVRPFNTYGPRQSGRAIIPTIVSQLLAGVTELKLGRTDTTRDFNFVADTVAGFISIAAAEGTVGREINVSSGTEITIGDLVQTLMKVTGRQAHVTTDDQRLRPAASEVMRLVGDNTLLRELTGWMPQVDLEAGLRETVRWFSDPRMLARYKHRVYNV